MCRNDLQKKSKEKITLASVGNVIGFCRTNPDPT
jgi:hypothetical protein